MGLENDLEGLARARRDQHVKLKAFDDLTIRVPIGGAARISRHLGTESRLEEGRLFLPRLEDGIVGAPLRREDPGQGSIVIRGAHGEVSPEFAEVDPERRGEADLCP